MMSWGAGGIQTSRQACSERRVGATAGGEGSPGGGTQTWRPEEAPRKTELCEGGCG